MKEPRSRFDGTVKITVEDESFAVRAALTEFVTVENIVTFGGPIRFESVKSWSGYITELSKTTLFKLAGKKFQIELPNGKSGEAVLRHIQTGQIEGIGLAPFSDESA